MDKVLDFIREHDNFAIFTHINPDGDALGSAFSLACALEGMGKKAKVILQEQPPVKFAFNEFVSLYHTGEYVPEYEAHIAVDCGDNRRLGPYKKIFFQKPTLNLDHHISNTCFADVNYVTDAPSTGEIIFDLYERLELSIGPVAQMAMYIAISTDTGNFTYANTTPKTLRICSLLMDSGLDISYVADRVYNSRSLGATKLICIFIEKLRLHLNGRLSISTILLEDIEQAGAKVEDCDVLINYARAIETVELAVFVRELKKDTYKISLRAGDTVNVADMAARYDGGGHKRAAGFMLKGDYFEVMQTVVKTAEEFLA